MNKSIILVATMAGTGFVQLAAAKKVDKNLLFIIVDDLNTTLGCYGHPTVKTPNIDRLAKQGVLFKNAYCNYPVSGPSRSSFLTGLYPETTTILDNKKTLASVLGERTTLPYLFKQNGYQTIGLGKVFHGKSGDNDPKCWDEEYAFSPTKLGETGEGRNISNGALQWCEWMAANGDDEDLQDGQNAAKAVEFIKRIKDKPFFLALGLHKPHDPFIAPKKYFDMYPLESCNPPVLPEGWAPPFKHTLPNETSIFNKFTDQDKREFLRSYYACTSYMDAQVGKVLKALDESGQMENTLIIFMGDNGYHLGEHNWWNKVTLFQKGTNPPFIVAGQSVGGKGIVSNSMFEFVDLYPTLADIFRLKNRPSYLEGNSFNTLLRNPFKPFRKSVTAVVKRGEKLGRMVKNEEWRYVEWDDAKMGVELYNQKNDPTEYANLAKDPTYKAVIDEMKKMIRRPKATN